jgi:bile acid-coenzyme A ligase
VPLGRILQHHAQLDPSAPAITIGERTITRGQLEARSNRRARLLASHGVGEGDLVTIALPNSLEFYETTFAVWKLGATPNPVSAALPPAELAAIVAVANPRLVIGAPAMSLPGRATLASCAEVDPALSADPLPTRVPKYWKAMTSGGSTGRPKVIVDHMDGAWDPSQPALGQRVGDVVVNPGPLYHNGPFLGTHYALLTGGHVIEMLQFDARRVLELAQFHCANWILLVPTLMHRIARLPDEVRRAYDLSTLRTIVHTAASCPAWLKRFWLDWLGPERVLEVYTGTERQAMTIITGREWLAHPGSVGRVQPGGRVRIVGEDGADLPPGETGEIYFLPDGGRNSTYHYLGAHAKALGEWESLGDLGWLDRDGYLYLADRRTDLIISGGVNIYPAEVEAALEAHPAIGSAIVIGLADEEWGQNVHAILQYMPGMGVTEQELRAFLAERLVRYKIPRSFEFVAHALRDEAGKARRSQLRAARSGGV